MKTLILASALFLLSFTSSFAGNTYSDVLVNIENRENGTAKEYLHMADNKPSTKYVYEYDLDGRMLSRILQYKDGGKSVWIGVSRYDYEYGRNGKLNNVLFTHWNAKTGNWSTTSQLLVHVYDADGLLVSVEQRKVNNYNKIIAIR